MVTPRVQRIGIVGLEHWYIGRDVPHVAARRDDATVVAVAHRHESNRREFAAQWHIPVETDDYMAVATHPDVDVIVTACTTSENVELALAAARHGKHLVTVKPVAMTVTDAQRLADGVVTAGVLAVPFEAYTRFQPHGRTIANAIFEGKIGRVVSAALVERFTIHGAQLDWPGQPNPNAWWMDPTKVPGGAWMDHAIYLVDWLRWALHDEVVAVSGIARALVYGETLDPSKDDFGVAILEFARGTIVTVEVTWSSAQGYKMTGWQLTGTEGDIAYDGTVLPGVRLRAKAGTPDPLGWYELEPQGGKLSIPASGADLSTGETTSTLPTSSLDHLLNCLADGSSPIASLADSVAGLRVCLAFEVAGRSGTRVVL